MAALILLVGLPAAGKTTRAKELAVERGALRLTPDEWMIPLFGESDAGGKRDVLEGRLISVALAVLRLATSVVLDFGCWSRHERSALHALALGAGAAFELVYLDVDPVAQRERVAQRWSIAADQTFFMTEADLVRWRELFEPPDAAELRGDPPGRPPPPWSSWAGWAAGRWPSLVVPAG